VDRTVKDLTSQIERREKQNTLLTQDLSKAREKISTLLSTIDELQTSDSTAQLTAKRAERELREARENSLRLERELEGWKGLRLERGSRAGSAAPGERLGLPQPGFARREGSVAGSEASLLRKVSNASRFL
jgi:myosin protein heavy chain